MSDKILVSGVEIEIIKKNIKNINLSVLAPDGRVRISAPKYVKDDAIRFFATTKISWIKKQIAKFESKPRQIQLEYVTGESHYLWGRRYVLEVKHSKAVNKVELKSNKLILTVDELSTAEQREKVINEMYRAELKAKLPPLIEKWEEIIGVKTNFAGIKNMRTRWGSCNVRDKRIWMNLQLAKKPINCLEYVVVHELVHLLERNHTKLFKGYMDKFLPDWRAIKHEINN